jgi:hypothetical protein
MGPVSCSRNFSRFGDAWVRLETEWAFGAPAMKERIYRELAMFGADPDTGVLSFWSYTNDGKRTSGTLVKAADVPPQAVCFEAQMPQGLARQIYWPGEDGAMHWAVDAKNKSGWKRFTEHRYLPQPQG